MNASVLITYRENGSEDRRANLLATLAWLAQSVEHEVIVVEQDALPRLNGELPHPRCRVAFAYNPGAFNKAWGLNLGARLARSNTLVYCDADMVISGLLDKSVSLCRNGFQLVKPYRRMVDLTREETAQVRAGDFDLQPVRGPKSRPNRESQSETVVLCGGIFVIRADAFRHLGGWDERFLGWGGEDDALSYKVQRARLSTVELDQRPALHLWHPRSVQATSGQPFYSQNRELLARYRRYSDPDLRRLAEVQVQVMGNREKYRPADE